jgi:hypothetical protein
MNKNKIRVLSTLFVVFWLSACVNSDVSSRFLNLKSSLHGNIIELQARLSPSGRWLLNYPITSNFLFFPSPIITLTDINKENRRYILNIPMSEWGSCGRPEFSPDDKKLFFICQSKIINTPQDEYIVIVSKFGEGKPTITTNRGLPKGSSLNYFIQMDKATSEYAIDIDNQKYLYDANDKLISIIDFNNYSTGYTILANRVFYQILDFHSGNTAIYKIAPPYDTSEKILELPTRISSLPIISPNNKTLVLEAEDESHRVKSLIFIDLPSKDVFFEIPAEKEKQIEVRFIDSTGLGFVQKIIGLDNGTTEIILYNWNTMKVENLPFLCDSYNTCLGWKEFFGGYLYLQQNNDTLDLVLAN